MNISGTTQNGQVMFLYIINTVKDTQVKIEQKTSNWNDRKIQKFSEQALRIFQWMWIVCE